MMKRRLISCRLKSECLEEYKEYHRNVWPELLEVYRRAGISSISCFLNGLQLMIYSEFVPQPDLNQVANEIGERWSKIMEAMADPSFQAIEYEEVFHMPSQPQA